MFYSVNVLHFRRAVGCSIRLEDVMEPDRRLVRIGLLPGIPGINRLGFARHEAPIVRADSLVMEITQHGIESAALGTGHVFGAEQRTMIPSQRFHTLPRIV